MFTSDPSPASPSRSDLASNYSSDPIPLSTPTLSKRPSFSPSLLQWQVPIQFEFPWSVHKSDPTPTQIRSGSEPAHFCNFPASFLRHSTTFSTNLTILINHKTYHRVIATCNSNHKQQTTIQMNQNGSKVTKTSYFPIACLSRTNHRVNKT